MKVGSLCECINDNWEPTITDPKFCAHIKFPTRGPIYTVRDIVADKDGTGIVLEEVVNPKEKWPDGTYGEARWGLSRFREVQPPMDISELLKECEPVKAMI